MVNGAYFWKAPALGVLLAAVAGALEFLEGEVGLALLLVRQAPGVLVLRDLLGQRGLQPVGHRGRREGGDVLSTNRKGFLGSVYCSPFPPIPWPKFG